MPITCRHRRLKVLREGIACRQTARATLAVPPRQAREAALNSTNGLSGSGVGYTACGDRALSRRDAEGICQGRRRTCWNGFAVSYSRVVSPFTNAGPRIFGGFLVGTASHCRHVLHTSVDRDRELDLDPSKTHHACLAERTTRRVASCKIRTDTVIDDSEISHGRLDDRDGFNWRRDVGILRQARIFRRRRANRQEQESNYEPYACDWPGEHHQSMPCNGYAHNLQASPVEGSSRRYPSSPDSTSDSRGSSATGAGLHSQLVKRPVWFRGWLYGVD
jgi:hypothetical protein